MSKMNNLLVLIVIKLLLTVNFSMGQDTVKIFQNESKKIDLYIGEYENIFNNSHFGQRSIQFKDKLPDGIYRYYQTFSWLRFFVDLDQYIEMEGTYKDSVRNGSFKYYNKTSRKNKLISKYNYKEGRLNGYYFTLTPFRSNMYWVKGYFEDGKRHGFFLFYDMENEKLEKIVFFYKDKIKYETKIENGKILKFEGVHD